MPVWLLATVGEEGLGNLRGATVALDASAVEIGAFVAVEGNWLVLEPILPHVPHKT